MEKERSAWQTWNVYKEVSDTFTKLSNYPLTVEESDLKTLGKFTILMYDRSSKADSVDDTRLDMFARKQRTYESIPPTRASLLQHVKRAAYQAGCIWSQATVCQPHPESPADWGWVKNGDILHIYWTTLPPISEGCQQLTKCACKKDCSGRCKCYKFGLPCTGLCSCKCDT